MPQRDTVPFEHEQVIRNFLSDSEDVGFYVPQPIYRKLIEILGYRTAPNGALIWNTLELKYRFGETQENLWVDTFDSDWRELCDARDAAESEGQCAAVDVDRPADTSTGEQTEGN